MVDTSVILLLLLLFVIVSIGIGLGIYYYIYYLSGEKPEPPTNVTVVYSGFT